MCDPFSEEEERWITGFNGWSLTPALPPQCSSRTGIPSASKTPRFQRSRALFRPPKSRVEERQERQLTETFVAAARLPVAPDVCSVISTRANAPKRMLRLGTLACGGDTEPKFARRGMMRVAVAGLLRSLVF